METASVQEAVFFVFIKKQQGGKLTLCSLLVDIEIIEKINLRLIIFYGQFTRVTMIVTSLSLLLVHSELVALLTSRQSPSKKPAASN